MNATRECNSHLRQEQTTAIAITTTMTTTAMTTVTVIATSDVSVQTALETANNYNHHKTKLTEQTLSAY